MSLNVHGMINLYKMHRFASMYLFPKFHNPPDIFCLQETNSVSNLESQFLQTWQHDLAFSHGPSGTGGLIVGFNRNLDYEVHDHKELLTKAGQILLLHCRIHDVELVIINVYARPEIGAIEADDFFAQLQIEIEQFGCPNILCCGDFNTIMDKELDYSGNFADLCSVPKTFRKSLALNKFIEATEFVDVYHVLNPHSCRMAHFSSGYRTGKHLDYIFASGFFPNSTVDASILPCRDSDHNPVVATFAFGRNPKGRGYWRFPDPLLENEDFLKHMKGKIKDAVADNRLDCTAVGLWDFVKMTIRQETIHFLRWDGIQDKIKNENFEVKLADLYFQRDHTTGVQAGLLTNSISKVTQEWHLFLSQLELKEIEVNLGCKRHEDQKSSKYFFHRFNAIPGSVTHLYDSDGNKHATDEQILTICHEFYEQLYNKPSQECNTPYAFIPEGTSPLLQDVDKDVVYVRLYSFFPHFIWLVCQLLFILSLNKW